MDTADLQVVRALATWSRDGAPAHLVTVLKTWGSSARPAGSLLAVGPDRQLQGSVSGGCVEDDLVQRLRDGTLAARRPERIEYGVTRAEGERFGLPCGGTLELLAEPLTPGNDFEPILDRLLARERFSRTLDLDSGASTLGPPGAGAVCSIDGQLFRREFGPRWQLVIVGAAQLSRCLAELALALDYQVLVVDPRADFADSWDLPGVEVMRQMPDDVVREHAMDERSAVVTLTHDPRFDDMALLEALESPAFYIGALGSEQTNVRRFERLRTLGVDDAAIQRLRAPVGLPIGSHAPMEIAVAIAAELVAVRNHAALADRARPATLATASGARVAAG